MSDVTSQTQPQKKFDPEAFAMNLAKAMESSGQRFSGPVLFRDIADVENHRADGDIGDGLLQAGRDGGRSPLSAVMPTELARHHVATQRRAEDSGRMVVRGMALNLALAAAKFAGGIFGHTYALIADGSKKPDSTPAR